MTITDLGGARFVGVSVPRREDVRLLAGRGRFLDDIVPEGVRHVAFVRSEVAHGRVRGVDVSAALALNGVHAVLTFADIGPLVREWWAGLSGPPSAAVPYPPRRPLADDDVRFVGDPIALVVADDRYVAEDATELVEVDIEVLPAVVDARTAAGSDVLVHPESGTNVARAVSGAPDPELDAIFADATHVIARTYREARASHAPMEPRGIIARWEPWDRSMRIWSSSQNAHEVRSFCARLLGIPEQRVHASIGDVGGGFGQKVSVSREEAAVMLAAYHLGGTLKWVEDRRENLIAAGHGRDDEIHLEMALDADGQLLGLRGRLLENVGAYPSSGIGSSAGFVGLMLPGPYRVQRVGFESVAVHTNTAARVAYRGPWLMESVGRERLIEDAARVLGIDPLELRRRNVIIPEDTPYRTATGQVYDSVAIAGCLELAAEAVNYEDFRAEQAAARGEGRHLGIGFGLYVEPSGVAPPGSLATEGVMLRIEPSGSVTVMTGAANCGNSIETTLPQIVADRLGCAVDDVELVQGDSATTPLGGGMGGSRHAPVYGGAVWTASTQLREKLLTIAAHVLECATDDLSIDAGAVSVRGTPSRSLSFAQLATVAYQQPGALPPGLEPGLEVLLRFSPDVPFTWSASCHVCVCEVDVETGIVRLLRYVVAEDCGTIINPMVVNGQVAGGVVQGIGGVLFEHFVYDDEGNPLTTTFLDYLLPLASDVPAVECHHVQTPSSIPGGFRGMGEGGAIGSPPAVANAVVDALSSFDVDLPAFPFGPSQLLAAIHYPADVTVVTPRNL